MASLVAKAEVATADVLAAVATAATVDGGALPVDAEVAAGALLGPANVVAVAADATIGSGSSAVDLAAAAVLGAGNLGSPQGGLPLVGGLLGGTGGSGGETGLPIVGSLLDSGAGTGGLLGGVPVVGGLLGSTGLGSGGLLGGLPGTGGLLGGVPIVGNLLGGDTGPGGLLGSLGNLLGNGSGTGDDGLLSGVPVVGALLGGKDSGSDGLLGGVGDLLGRSNGTGDGGLLDGVLCSVEDLLGDGNGTGGLLNGLPIVGDLLGGSGSGDAAGTGILGDGKGGGLLSGAPVVGGPLGDVGTGASEIVAGLPLVGDLLGTGSGKDGLLNGVPVLGDLVGDIGNGLAAATTDGDGTLLAEVVDLPPELLGIGDDTGNLEGAVHDLGLVLGNAGTLVNALGDDAGDVLDQPLGITLNEVVFDTHAFLETVGHDAGLNDTLHAVMDFGSTVGLGEIGGDNLLTDLLEVPGVVVNGGDLGAQLGDINADLSDVLATVPPVVAGLVADLGDGPTGLGVTGDTGLVAELAGSLSGASTGGLPILGHLLGGDAITLPALGNGSDSLVGTLADTVGSVTQLGGDGDGGGLLAGLDLGDILGGGMADHPLPDACGCDHHGAHGLGLI